MDLPPEWLARLQSLEQTTQATQIAVAKNDGALDGMGQQLRGFTQTTQSTLETLRHAVDERLAQAVAESRNGRAELLAALAYSRRGWSSASRHWMRPHALRSIRSRAIPSRSWE